MGFNSWNNNNPSAGGGGATLATAGVPGGPWGSLLHHHPMRELLPVLLLIPQMDLMKRIWFWNYVHQVVCESLCEAYQQDFLVALDTAY